MDRSRRAGFMQVFKSFIVDPELELGGFIPFPRCCHARGLRFRSNLLLNRGDDLQQGVDIFTYVHSYFRRVDLISLN
jgi:hypothetical protein